VVPFESVSFFLVASLAFFFYYERIAAAEEAFLIDKFGERYQSWAAKTPAFFPNPVLWRRPDRPFSLRKVFRREPPGWVLVATFFTVFEIFDDVLFAHEGFLRWSEREPVWLVLLALGLCLYTVSKILRHTTTVLNVDDMIETMAIDEGVVEPGGVEPPVS
jgi:hypothetical protein